MPPMLWKLGPLRYTVRFSPALPFAHASELMRSVIESAPVAFFELDAQGVVLFSGGAPLQSVAGRPLSTVGRSVFDVYAHVPAVGAAVRRALAGEAFADSAIVVPGVGGENVVFQTAFTPVTDEQGRVERVLGIATDISPRARAIADLVAPMPTCAHSPPAFRRCANRSVPASRARFTT